MGGTLHPMRVILVILLALLLFPANAEAGWRRERATAIAQIVWNHPCNDQVKLAWVPLGGTYLGWNDAPCSIKMATEFHTDWPSFCTAIIHEYGHVAGVWHNTNIRSVMYERPLPDERCAANGRPYLEKHSYLLPRPR